MNANIFIRSTSLCAGLAMLTAPSIALAQSQDNETLQVFSATSLDGSDKSEQLHVRIDNGKIRVVRNGKEVPIDQIKTEDGRIVIVDEDGNEVNRVQLRVLADPSVSAYSFGPDGAQLRRQFEPAEEPNVMVGLQMGEPSEALLYHLGLEKGETTFITGLYEGLPAHDAGIRQYDIITAVNGETPADAETIRKALSEMNPGDTVAFTVLQAGRKKDVHVKVAAWDRKAMDEAKLIGAVPQAEMWTSLFGDRMKEMPLIQPNVDMPQVFVAPPGNWQGRIENFNPDMFQHYYEFTKPRRSYKSVEEQLDRLDKRMAELEKLLQKAIEKPREASGR